MVAEQHVGELIAGYALGCLDLEDEQQVRAHLAQCEACRRELRSYQAVVEHLSLAVPQRQPPAGARDRLMARLQTGAQAVEPPAPANPPGSWWQRLQNALGGLSPAWGLAGLLVLIVLIGSNLLWWQQVQQLQTVPQPALQVINLSGTVAAPEAIGMIVVSMDGEHGTLVVDHLPALDDELQYQLWLIHDGQRDDGGAFSVSADGYGAVWVESPAPLDTYSAFGITIEPAGGSPGPTGERVLGVQLDGAP